MLAKNFEQFMKNNKFKKKFSNGLKKAPHIAELEKAEKKDPRGHQCGVSSHVRPRGPPPQKKPPRYQGPPPRNPVPRYQQQQKPTPTKKTWVPKKSYVEIQKTTEREIFYEGTPFVSSFMRDLVRYLKLQLNKGGQDKEEDTHSPRGSRST
jgi:hypothetical protein